MHSQGEARRAAIGEVGRRLGVRRLEGFGSAAAGDFDPQRSDVDVLVHFSSNVAADPLGEYFALKTGLKVVLGRPVDVLIDGAVLNP